jgi:two-component system, NarL family, response regulator FusR
MTKKMMIVDDRAIARHLVRQVATTPHDTVLECVSADEALKAVGIFKPDCVVMGVSRPHPGAFQAIRQIRTSHTRVRVVAMSSVPEVGLRQLAREAGASGYVTSENLSELFLLAAPERVMQMPSGPVRPRRRNP